MIRFLLFLFVSVLLHASDTSSREKVSVQLLWLDQFEFAGFYMAKEKGFYRDAGLEVEIKPFKENLDIPHDVAQGKTTYGIGYSSILIDKGNGLPIIAIGALFQSSPLAIAVKKTSDIQTINDLKNKKIMVTHDHKNDASIMAMLTSRGLQKNDFTLLPHSFNIQDLINNKTDAMLVYTTNEPYTLLEKGVHTTILDPKEYGFDFYGDILYTSEHEIKNHPERVKKFQEATMKGWRYAFEHIDESVELITKHYNSQKKSKEALTYEANALMKLSALNSNEFGKLNAKKLQSIDNVYRLMGMMHQNIDMNAFVWHGAQARPAEDTLDYNLGIKIFAFLLALMALLLWWNRKLHLFNRKIKRLSIIDELSGLYNRRYFNTKFSEIHSEVMRQRRYFFFILLDIDNFKKYNDNYGHLKGDDVIALIGKTLKALFNRHTDIAFRLGGEEFGCFGSSDSREGALAKAEEIRLHIEVLAIKHSTNPPYNVVTFSGGIVILSSDSPAENQEMIYHRADNALYKAKEAGRNRIVQAP